MQRKRTTAATSAGRPKRPMGKVARNRSCTAAPRATSSSISVSITEGSTALTVMLSRASSRAAFAVSASKPALLAA